jgi:short-subunit dehydrogenase
MRVHLKPVEDQIIVITGATSGIGLATAKMAARRGARLVLVGRDEKALRDIETEIRRDGGEAIFVVADVADEDAMMAVAETTLREFGGFDTWINNAGVSIYGKVEKTSMEDHRRLFDTNYWGIVIGSRIAATHLRHHGGALINLGSILSDRAVPLQAAYCASKHAVKGFTNGLRMELEADGAPVSVTLIKPAAIDTMFEEHARSLTNAEPLNPPPVYAPELVARAILHAAEHPTRDLIVGGAGKLISMSERVAPRLTDRIMEAVLPGLQRAGGPLRRSGDNLYGAFRDGRERSGRHAIVRESSLYTTAVMHPLATAAAVAGLGVLAAAMMGGSRYASRPSRDSYDPGI